MPGGALPTLEAPLTFIAPTNTKPQVLMSANHADANIRTGAYHTLQVAIADARGLAERPNLDREGFSFETLPTRVTDFYDAGVVKGAYYDEIAAFLKRVTGAADAYVFDHTLRVEDPEKRQVKGARLPVTVVHNDYTETSAPKRVRDMYAPEIAERLLKGRFAILNVWRSIGSSAERFPLAVADGRTVRPTDHIAVDLVYPDRTGEVLYTAHSSGQRWYYLSGMLPTDVMVFKCFDSARDGRTRYTAHAGFANPFAPAETPPRESIEVRTLLFFA